MNKQQAKDLLALWDRSVALYRLYVKTGEGLIESLNASMGVYHAFKGAFGIVADSPAITALGK